MLPSALIMEGTPLSYFSGFQNTTAVAVRLRLSLIVRGLLYSIDLFSDLMLLISKDYICLLYVDSFSNSFLSIFLVLQSFVIEESF